MNRYELLIQSIHDSNLFVVNLFLFTIFAVLAYPVLGWTPPFLRRPLQGFYLALVLIGFLFVTVYFGQPS